MNPPHTISYKGQKYVLAAESSALNFKKVRSSSGKEEYKADVSHGYYTLTFGPDWRSDSKGGKKVWEGSYESKKSGSSSKSFTLSPSRDTVVKQMEKHHLARSRTKVLVNPLVDALREEKAAFDSLVVAYRKRLNGKDSRFEKMVNNGIAQYTKEMKRVSNEWPVLGDIDELAADRVMRYWYFRSDQPWYLRSDNPGKELAAFEAQRKKVRSLADAIMKNWDAKQ